MAKLSCRRHKEPKDLHPDPLHMVQRIKIDDPQIVFQKLFYARSFGHFPTRQPDV
jgi:hypothetical protein